MKIKNQIHKQQEKEFQLDLSFQEWLDYFSKKSSSEELDDIEKQSANNSNYQPLKEV